MKTGDHQFLNPLAPSSMKPLVEKFKGFKIHLSWDDKKWNSYSYNEKDIDEFIDDGWKKWQDSDNLPKWLLAAIMFEMDKSKFTSGVIKAYETVMQRIKDGKLKEIKITPPKPIYKDVHPSLITTRDRMQRLDPKYWK